MNEQVVVRVLTCAAVGLGLGGILGHTIGLEIRSDNLPFFDLLGTLAGVAGGFTACAIWSRLLTNR